MRTIFPFAPVLFLFSCQESNTQEIRDFSKPHTFTLKTEKGQGYYKYAVRLEGFVDDSVKLSGYGFSPPQKVKGEIDTLFAFDFYGQVEQLDLTIDPYKAKSGHLTVTQSAD